MTKDIAQLTLGPRIAPDEMEKIYKEIDTAPAIIDQEMVIEAKDAGLMSDEFAAKSLGIPPGEAKKGAEDHAARLARIQAAQTKEDGSTTGVSDMSTGPDVAKAQKTISQNADNNPSGTKKVRGQGRRY